MKKWGALVVLALAQFLMVLDQSVMNVSISQLVEDFDTTVTTIQGVITLYSLVMAAFMITGGKIGDLIGRRKAFGIGLVIYGCGSALTAVSWSVPSLTLGWSVIEGLGAALVLPALAALIAGNYEGRDRVAAYAVIGGVAGAGIAIGPILGGWATTELSWRVVFAGEVAVVVIILILVGLGFLTDAVRPGPAPKLDAVGSVLSATGLALVVLGVLQASTWGWVAPKDSPVEPFGFSLTPFVVAAGFVVLALFRWWEARREGEGLDPLVRFALFDIKPLRSGLSTFFAQNLILMGVFFAIPLYLQLVQGLDALETGIQMLPVSVTMLITALGGSALAARFPTRAIVRAGLVTVLLGILGLLMNIDPELNSISFGVALGIMGIGMGLMASQLGNVVQSSVGAEERSEAGGLQYTAQQLGSALGVALIGSIVLTGLLTNFVNTVNEDERISAEAQEQVGVATSEGVSFVASDDVAQAAVEAGLDDDTTAAIVEDYEDAQLLALKAGLLATAAIVALSFLGTANLPAGKPTAGNDEEAAAGDGPGEPAQSSQS
jgi:EmrB/QacA subfamily drug resistance transporter